METKPSLHRTSIKSLSKLFNIEIIPVQNLKKEVRFAFDRKGFVTLEIGSEIFGTPIGDIMTLHEFGSLVDAPEPDDDESGEEESTEECEDSCVGLYSDSMKEMLFKHRKLITQKYPRGIQVLFKFNQGDICVKSESEIEKFHCLSPQQKEEFIEHFINEDLKYQSALEENSNLFASAFAIYNLFPFFLPDEIEMEMSKIVLSLGIDK